MKTTGVALQQQLIRKRDKLRTRIWQQATSEAHRDCMADPLDAASYTTDLNTRASSTCVLQHVLVHVNKALLKLELGTYGRCDECGRPIDPARLAHTPFSILCLECQRRRETEHTLRHPQS